MIILAADTSTRTGSVAVVQNRTILAEISTTGSQTHARRLMSIIDGALEIAGVSLEGCDGFAVTTGPGSFTGLRIGISTIKGLAVAMRKPVAGVTTLEVLACQFPHCPHPICPVLDARKGQIYTALYACDDQGEPQKTVEDCAVEPQGWLAQIQGTCLFVGDGTTAYGDLIKEIMGPRAFFAPPYLNAVRASAVGFLAMTQFLAGEATDAGNLRPHYVRKSDAEMKKTKSS